MKKIYMLLTAVMMFVVGQYSECAAPRPRLVRAPRVYNLSMRPSVPSLFGNVTIPTPAYEREYPLHAQVMRGNAVRVAELAKDRSLINSRDEREETPLHIAAQSCNPEITKILLTSGAQVDAVKGIVTPLMEAININCLSVVKLLLDAGADPDYQLGRQNYTLLHFVVGRSPVQLSDADQAIVRLLLSYGANPEVQFNARSVIDVARDWRNDSLVTLLESAVRRRELAKREVVNLAIARGLVVKGAPVDEQLFNALIEQHAVLRGIYMRLLGE